MFLALKHAKSYCARFPKANYCYTVWTNDMNGRHNNDPRRSKHNDFFQPQPNPSGYRPVDYQIQQLANRRAKLAEGCKQNLLRRESNVLPSRTWSASFTECYGAYRNFYLMWPWHVCSVKSCLHCLPLEAPQKYCIFRSCWYLYALCGAALDDVVVRPTNHWWSVREGSR